jgi:hypothetical protein
MIIRWAILALVLYYIMVAQLTLGRFLLIKKIKNTIICIIVIIWDNNYAAAVFLEELYFFVPVCCVGRCLFSFCNKAVWYYIEIEGMKR